LGSIGSNNKEVVDFLIENLQNKGNPPLREAAADSLVKIAKAPSLTEAGQAPYPIASLISVLQSDSPKVRDITADTLKKIGGQQVIDSLILTLGDEQYKAGSEVEKLLISMKDAGAFTAMIDSLKSDNPGIRLKLVQMMGGNRDPLFFDPVVRMLGDSDRDVQTATILALKRFGDPRATGPLLAMLNENSSVQISLEIISALSAIKDPRSVEKLSGILMNSKDMEIRIAAARALGDIGSAQAVTSLLSVFSDTNLVRQMSLFDGNAEESLRAVIVEALGKIKDPEAVEPLVKALNDPDESVQYNAVIALGEIGDSRAVGPLVKVALTEKLAEVRLPGGEGSAMVDVYGVYGQFRMAAANALKKIGGYEAIAELARALKSENDKTREMADEALKILREAQ
jgi:HEAT repeat protein